ncbi:MAG: hypothetical protein AAF600_17585 [Bacteroidota bacterium]
MKAAILLPNSFCTDSCNYLLGNNEYPNEVIMLLLNSSLYIWIFKKTSTNSNVNGYEIDNMTVPKLSSDVRSSMQDLANTIIELKKDQKSSLELERKVDIIVYKLYSLDYVQIKIIDPDFWLSEEAYNNFSLEELKVE